MDHHSGFSTDGSPRDWQTMKSNEVAGVSFFDIGDPDYENMNFGLIRILMATIGGYMHPNTNFGFEFMRDLTWEVLNVTRAFRQANIVSLGGMSDIIQNSWGLNSPIGGESTLAGNIYYKAGRWTNGGDPATDRTEQCFVILMPNEMELVVFVNSQITSQGMSLTNLVRTLFINNIVGP